MANMHAALADQFDDMPQQREAATLGMWTFLATEILFFGGMFLAYVTYRHLYPQAFALASRHTIVLYGTINTAILLTSSLTMALAVQAAQLNSQKWLFRFLLLTVFLAVAFWALKLSSIARISPKTFGLARISKQACPARRKSSGSSIGR